MAAINPYVAGSGTFSRDDGLKLISICLMNMPSLFGVEDDDDINTNRCVCIGTSKVMSTNPSAPGADTVMLPDEV